MTKSPESGRVKTRLVAHGYSERWVTALSAAFLIDTLSALSHPVLAVREETEVLLCLDGDPAALPERLRNIPHLVQEGNSLGERLVSLCDTSFGDGVQQLVIVGSDTPHLPTAFVQEAFGRLASGADAVFGPAVDGGYYLVGLCRPLPALFMGVPWSTGDVLQTTLNIAGLEGVRTALLPPLYDIDTEVDLRRLQTDLKRRVALAPATARFLAHPDGIAHEGEG